MTSDVSSVSLKSKSAWSIFWLGWKDKAFLKEISSVALPILVSNTINTMLQLIDQLMLASLGTKTLAAVTYVNLIYFFTGIIFFGIGSASAIFLSRLFAQKDYEQMNQVKALSVAMGWVFCIFTIIIAVHFPHQVLSLYTNDQEVIEIGTVFFRNIAYGQPFFAVAAVYIYLLRILGFGKTAMMGSIIAFATNTLLNYLLIFGHWGFPALGVLGAAIATNLARVNMMIYYLLRVYRSAPTFNLRFKEFFHIPISLVKIMFKTALLLILGDAIWGITLNLYSSIFGHMSNDAAATYSIALMFRQLTIMITFAITPAIMIVMGGIIGKPSTTYAEIRELAIKCQGFGFIFSVLVGTAFFILSPILLYTFYSNLPENILTNASIMVIILACLLPLMTANNFFGAGIFRAGGDTKINLIFIIAFNLCVSFPLAYWWGNIGLGVIAVFVATYIGDMLRFCGFVIHFIRAKWIFNLEDSSHSTHLETENH